MARWSSKGRWTRGVGSLLKARLRRRIAKLSDDRSWQRNTAAVQRRQLRWLLNTARFTRFGRAHDFAGLATLSDEQIVPAYQRAVACADWYRFRHDIAEMREHGRPDVLWPGLVEDFAQTSGTTAGDKFIPLTREMMRSNYRAALDIFANAVRFGVDLPHLTAGRALFLGGSTSVDTNRHGVRTGDLSGLVTPMIRWPISEIYSPGPEIALMNHWPSKIEAMAHATLDQDVRMINGMPSWALVLMTRVLELARARGLKADTIRDVWPNLTLFVHGGVKYAPFDPRVRTLFSGSPTGDDIPFRLELYPASEGFIAMQDRPGEASLRLLSDIGNFYEFVPIEEIDAPSPRAFTADEVEPGQRYVVVMTTCAGLWRYIIGDVVEFDSAPCRLDGSGGWGTGAGSRLRIVGRHRHFINAFGENLIVEHIENAVAAAAEKAGVVVGEFTAAPVYPDEGGGRRAGLELLVEVSPSPDGSDINTQLKNFRDAFDASLKSQNVDYTTKRTDGLGMAEPTISVVQPGTFHAWLSSRGKLGGQHKCPRCANHRDIIEAVRQASS